MPAYPGPTANLRGTARRSGRAGTVWIDGNMRGEVVGLEWGLQVAQIPVPIPGTWQDENKPGAETRAGTFHYQDVDDTWRLFVWDFCEARRNGAGAGGAAFPEFDIITKLSDIGAPAESIWVLEGCQFFQLDGGSNQTDDLLVRDVPFSYRHERPLNAFTYGPAGIVVRQG